MTDNDDDGDNNEDKDHGNNNDDEDNDDKDDSCVVLSGRPLLSVSSLSSIHGEGGHSGACFDGTR